MKWWLVASLLFLYGLAWLLLNVDLAWWHSFLLSAIGMTLIVGLEVSDHSDPE